MEIRALTWNLFHGRDFPPNRELFTWRSRLLKVTERDSTHLQVNRDLTKEFTAVIARAEWDVALLQECPPRWAEPLAAACRADAHRSLTSRNALGPVRAALGRWNPDFTGSSEGGSNLTLVRGALREAGGIAERRELELCRRPERRTMAFARLPGLCVANLHASTHPSFAEEEVHEAAATAIEWAGALPLVLGGDFNVRPAQTRVFEELEERCGLTGITAPDSIDHLLTRGLERVAPARAWPAEERELRADGLRLRLSDHAPVEALLRAPDARG